MQTVIGYDSPELSQSSLQQEDQVDWRYFPVICRGKVKGYLKEIYGDRYEPQRFFTIENETPNFDDEEHLYPIEFVESVFDDRVYLVPEFEEIERDRYYSYSHVQERENFQLVCDFVSL